MAEPAQAYVAPPYDYGEARALVDALGVSEPLAVTLVRRGYRTAVEARAFLAADESHPASAFEGIEAIVGRIRIAVDAGERITVHGDFDVDGVCATSVMVTTLRRLGAEVDWLIPDRIEDGYGLSAGNVERLAARGTRLILTVDCGITAVDQVKLARELGVDVIVTDHHQPDDQLPDCPILHPVVCGYPFEGLCGTAVAWKLALALRAVSVVGSPGALSRGVPGDPTPDPAHDPDLDLVALATVADVVPLVGENRALVRKGLAEMKRGRRVGLRALMAASRCEPTRLDEGDIAFRLAPRINAAGRLYRADAGVELMLTEDEERATAIAEELGRANSERRATEREVDAAAESARRELREDLAAAPAIVVAGEGWHPGVVGIVASRLVERHHRPAIVIALDGEGGGRGSGRSIPGFDLHAALGACAAHLESFGGHRAAAGLSLRAENLDAFRAAFCEHAADVLGPDDLRRTERIDAMVGGLGLGIDLAEELGSLGPFGMGNPGVRLLVPSARVSDVRTMGEDGKHSRFSLHSGPHRALGVAFGRASLGVEPDEPLDAAVRLEVNHWNGSVEPRVVLREVYPLGDGEETPPFPHSCRCGEEEWWQRFAVELRRDPNVANRVSEENPLGGDGRSVVAGGAANARIAELVSSGAGVLAICADASRRAALAGGATGMARFNGGSAHLACGRCGREEVEALAVRGEGGLALVDFPALALAPELGGAFEHVVLVDAPRSEADVGRAAFGGGYLHPVFTAAEAEFGADVLALEAPDRRTVAAVFHALRERTETSGADLRAVLAGSGPRPLAPAVAARALRVLLELELVVGDPIGGDGVSVVSSSGTELERSAAFRAYRRDHSEAEQFLKSPKFP